MCYGCRNFGEGDYEALLELDSEPAVARPQLSERELGRLQTHIHRLKTEALPKRPPRLVPGNASSCADKVGQRLQGGSLFVTACIRLCSRL